MVNEEGDWAALYLDIGRPSIAPEKSTFSKNRERLLEGPVAARFLSTMVAQAKVKRLLSPQRHAMLVQAWLR